MDIIKPGLFSRNYSADSKRRVFDFQNEQILTKNKDVDFVFTGDSITEFWDLSVYFDNSSYIVNRGIGGDISEIILKRFDADVLQLNPRNVICLVGCNDLMTMHYDYWWKVKGKEIATIVDELLKNTEEIIKKCEDIHLYICSVLPSSLCIPYNADEFNETILKVNCELKKLCEKYSATYIDYHSVMCEEDGKTIKENLTYDGIHPTPQGYEIMAGVLKKNIKGLK